MFNRFITLSIHIYLIFFWGCGNALQDKSKTNARLPEAKKEKLRIDSSRQSQLINLIENSDCYYGKVIGITGETSPIYKAYEELQSFASDSLWMSLSFSKSVVMRLYAFKAIEKNMELREEVRRRYLKDSTVVCVKISDIETNLPLGRYLELVK